MKSISNSLFRCVGMASWITPEHALPSARGLMGECRSRLGAANRATSYGEPAALREVASGNLRRAARISGERCSRGSAPSPRSSRVAGQPLGLCDRQRSPDRPSSLSESDRTLVGGLGPRPRGGHAKEIGQPPLRRRRPFSEPRIPAHKARCPATDPYERSMPSNAFREISVESRAPVQGPQRSPREARCRPSPLTTSRARMHPRRPP